MRCITPSAAIALAALALGSASAPAALADIIGFNDLNGWRYNQAPSDVGTPADLPDPNTIHLTNGAFQARSIFFNTRQSVSEFTASFVLRASHNGGNSAHGATFTLHNSPSGSQALGSSGPGLGYAGIQNSVAISFEIVANRTGFFTGGVIGSANAIDTITLGAGNDIEVTLTYSGNFLTQLLVDSVTGASFSRNIFVGDLSTHLGDDHAYVGLTASTNSSGLSSQFSHQFFSDFRFTVPAPGAAVVLTSGLLAAARRRRQ